MASARNHPCRVMLTASAALIMGDSAVRGEANAGEICDACERRRAEGQGTGCARRRSRREPRVVAPGPGPA